MKLSIIILLLQFFLLFNAHRTAEIAVMSYVIRVRARAHRADVGQMKGAENQQQQQSQKQKIGC